MRPAIGKAPRRPRSPRRRLAVRSSTAACIAALTTGGALATWEFNGSAGLIQSWSENTTFSAVSGNGDAITSLRLTGEVVETGPQSDFRLSYTPSAQFYRDQTSLNYVGHAGRASYLYRFSDRNSVTLTDQFVYTPDQELDPQAYQSHLLYTSYGGRRTNLGAATWRHTLTPSSTFYADLRFQYRSFVDPSLIDNAGLSSSLRWERNLSPRTIFDMGFSSSWNRFTRPRCTEFNNSDPNKPGYDPNQPSMCIEYTQDYPRSQVRTLFAGTRYEFTPRFNGSLRLGRNYIYPEIVIVSQVTNTSFVQHGDVRRGLHASANLNYSGRRFNAQGGYQRDLSSMSGTYALADAETVYANLSVAFSADLTGIATLNFSRSASLNSQVDSDVSAFWEQGEIRWRLHPSFSANALFNRNIQSSGRAGAPDLAFNRYAVGIVASFR